MFGYHLFTTTMPQLYSEYASDSPHFYFLTAYFYFGRPEVGKKMPGDQKDPVLSIGYIHLYLKTKLCDLQLFQNSQSIRVCWTASLYHLSDIILTLQKAGFHTVNKFHPNQSVSRSQMKNTSDKACLHSLTDLHGMPCQLFHWRK